MMRFKSILGMASILALAACAEVLDVPNPNDPETDRVLASPADVEALLRDSYIQALEPMLQSDGINMQLGAVALESSPMAANFGMIERSAFPRAAIINTVANQFSGDYYEVWSEEYAAIRAASDGLAKLADADFTLGSTVADARAEAFGNFVLFLAHATLAVTYDSASIYDETVPAADDVPLSHYSVVMAAALGYANDAIALATANPTMSFPADWFGEDVNAARFIQIVNSFKARYRVQVARNASETIDWSAVITEANAGITTDYAPVDDDNRFDFWMQDYMSFQGAWHQVPYFVHGMADQSGAYQTWINDADIMTRDPFVIVTPDRRFPQGADLATQRLNPGLNIRAKINSTGEGGWIRAERGTWRWSHYLDVRYQDYYDATNAGLPIPIIQVKEVQLIKAEALYRRNTGTDRVDAQTIVNNYRTTDGGLTPSLIASGATIGDCVPKLPNGTCGDFFETLKWEKRMILFMTVYGGWYFDSRRWGDLPLGTFLSYPVPARELEVRQLPLYTHGGAAAPGNATAPVGTYGY